MPGGANFSGRPAWGWRRPAPSRMKSIVKIRFVEKQPSTAWIKAAPEEYGFYSNANPDIPHRRWPQAHERRLGEFFRRKTLAFNGYAEQVAHLYAGMDLRKYF